MIGNYEELKKAIADAIYSNTDEKITGDILQNVLTNIILTLGENPTFAGIATPTTNPGQPDQNVFYLASTVGTYSNFGSNIKVNDTAIVIYLDKTKGAWAAKETGLPTLDLLAKAMSFIPLAGSINPAGSNAASEIQEIYRDLAENSMKFYIISDSLGSFLGSEVTFSSSVAKLFNKDTMGASVGDLLVIGKIRYLGQSVAIYRIIPLNDAKAAKNGFPGCDGLETIWDKTQINKIPGLENTLLSKLNISDALPSKWEWESNMNNCLSQGVYPWCLTGRPSDSEVGTHYTLVVQKTSTRDSSGFNTIIQTCFGRQGADLGKIYQRLIFEPENPTQENPIQYGEWQRLNTTRVKFTGESTLVDFNNYVNSLIRSSDAEARKDWSSIIGPRTVDLDGMTVEVNTSCLSIARGDYTQMVSGPVLLDQNTGVLKRTTAWHIYRRVGLNGVWSHWEDLHLAQDEIATVADDDSNYTKTLASFNEYLNAFERPDTDTIAGRRDVRVIGYISEVTTRATGASLGRYVQKIAGPIVLKSDGTLTTSRDWHEYVRRSDDFVWGPWKLLNS